MSGVSLGYLHVDANSNCSEQILDEEFGILPIKTPGVRKTNEPTNLTRLGRNKSLVQRFTFDGDMLLVIEHICKKWYMMLIPNVLRMMLEMCIGIMPWMRKWLR